MVIKLNLTPKPTEPKKRAKCLLCGKETDYTEDTPVGDRMHYVEGAGQLCPQCHYETYVKENEEKKWTLR